MKISNADVVTMLTAISYFRQSKGEVWPAKAFSRAAEGAERGQLGPCSLQST